MANVNRPSGFQPYRQGAGAPYNGRVTQYYIPSSDGSAYAVGDLVIPAEGCDPVTFAPYIAKAAASATNLLGAIVGIDPDPNNLTLLTIPATKTRGYTVYVADDPNEIFECTDDGLTAAKLVSTAVGQNADYTVTNPTAPAVVSASVINSSTIATTNTLPLKIVGFAAVPGNTFGTGSGTAQYARWLVRINQHYFRGNVAGV